MFSNTFARTFACAAIAFVPAAAHADHAGPTGGPSAGGGINTVSASTLDEGHWAAGVRIALTNPVVLADAELVRRELAGIDAHAARRVINASLGIAYGVTHDLSLSAELPYVSRDAIRASDNGAVINRGTSAGFGDLTLLAKYRPVHSKGWELALIGGIKAPSGNTAKRDSNGDRFETEHQPGTGSWDPIAGFATSHATGANRIDASLLYQFAAQGAQSTRLGDRAQAGVSLSHRFGAGEPVDHAHADHDETDHHHTTIDAVIELLGEWEGKEAVGGLSDAYTGGSSVWIAPGARFNFEGGWSVAGSLGVPIYQRIRASHPDNSYRVSVSVGRAF